MNKNTPLSYIELSEGNLIHNLKQFRKLANSNTKLSFAIKGNAYGHGIKEIVKILNSYVDYFQVDSLEELQVLRQSSKKQVFVFGYVQKSDLVKVMKLKCVLSIFSAMELKEINKQASRLNIKQEIHVPVDAYLGREGFLLKELPKIFKIIKKCKHVKISGIYAHFANIEDTTDFSHAKKQIDEYERSISLANKFGFHDLQTHISATSGLLVYEKNKGIYSIVRLGIGVYGMWPSEQLRSLYKNKKFKLRPVLVWKTKIAQIKILPKGNTIGYGLTYKTRKETKIALIPQGYADGIPRILSNKGEVLIQGTRCRILGRVMMNMFLVDISSLKKIRTENGVVILGKQGKEEISAEEIAKKANTINYEITTRISALLPRIICKS